MGLGSGGAYGLQELRVQGRRGAGSTGRRGGVELCAKVCGKGRVWHRGLHAATPLQPQPHGAAVGAAQQSVSACVCTWCMLPHDEHPGWATGHGMNRQNIKKKR